MSGPGVAGAGGPVPRNDTNGPSGPADAKTLLNTYIYDYFIKEEQLDLAKALLEKSSLQVSTQQPTKTSPSRRDINGVDDDNDSKDEVKKKLAEMPVPKVPGNCPGDAFLYDWWCIFWDVWGASRQKTKSATAAGRYLDHTQQQSRMRQQQTQTMLAQSAAMLPGNMNSMAAYRNMVGQLPNGMPNGMMNNMHDLQKRAMANSRNTMNPQFQQNMQQRMQAQQLAQSQMQRDGSELDANGQPRQQSPIIEDNAPSPKRQRTMDANGTPAPTTMLMQNGVDPNSISQAQFQQQLANSNPNMQKALQQQYASSLLQHHQRPGMADKGLSNPGAIQHSSPMMTQGPDGNLQMNSDFFGATPAGAMQRGLQGNGGSGGALADYQMQLMLLEQQNKKRLMMARQEQAAGEGGVGPVPGMIGQPGFAPMSPRGSRNGQSPIMNDQMKRGTPKMGQNSPLPDGTMPGGRASPGTNSFEGVTMPPNMGPQFYPQMMNGAQGGMMRPPAGHPGFQVPTGPMNQQQMDMLRQQGMRMQNGQWAGPQGMPGQPGAQQQGQAGDNGQMRNHNMPPPQAPQAAGAGSARTQPSSPQQLAAPPTPVQNKGGKQVKGPAKEPANKKKPAKPANKGAATAPTPSSEADPAPASTPPPPPITPVHPNSFAAKTSVVPNMNPQQAAGNMAHTGVGLQQDTIVGGAPGPFGSIDATTDIDFGRMDFVGLDNADVLEGFDFDTFLHTDQDGSGFDFDTSQFAVNGDGIETGTGDV